MMTNISLEYWMASIDLILNSSLHQTEDTSTSTNATLLTRIFGGLTYSFLSSIGAILNILLVMVLVRDKSFVKNSAFYVIVYQLIICDLLTHFMQLIIAVPITFAGRPLYGNIIWLLAGFDTIAYAGTLYFSFVMTINRFTCLLFPQINQVFFGKTSTFWTITGTWLLVFWYVISLNLGHCTKDFEHDGFYYYHKCEKLSVSYKNYGQYVYQFGGIMSTYLPIVMLIGYVCIFVYLKSKQTFLTKKQVGIAHIYTLQKNSVTTNNKEYALLIQSFLICGSIEVQNIAFTFLPSLPLEGQWVYIVNFAQNWISLLMSSMNPIVLFIFNRDIREALKRLVDKTFFRRYITTNRGVQFYSSNKGIWYVRSPTQYNQNPYF